MLHRVLPMALHKIASPALRFSAAQLGLARCGAMVDSNPERTHYARVWGSDEGLPVEKAHPQMAMFWELNTNGTYTRI